MAQCISPVRLFTGEFVPCNKCHECLTTRANGWAFRLKKEAERSSSAFFITLTYNEENVPTSSNGEFTLRKEDLQKYFKRLRKLNEEKLKYYAVGEYGGQFKRPHYHVILFNADIETIDKAWKLDDEEIGYIKIGDVTPASVAYTLKYIQSGIWRPEHELDDRNPQFAVMSKGLGSNYLTDSMRKWHKRNIVDRFYLHEEQGKKVKMPRYYKEKLYTEHQRKMIGSQIVAKNVDKFMLKNKIEQAKIAVKEELIKIEKYHKAQRQKAKY